MEEARFKLNRNEFLPLRDVVFRAIRDAILTSRLGSGERLLENQLAEELGVSRTPVREALRMLELEGLVELLPRKGAQVLEISKKDIAEILEIRTALEGLATSLACKRITSHGLEGLKVSGEIFEQAVAGGDKDKIIECDEAFHDIIFASTENQRLIQMYENLRTQLYRYRMAHLQLDDSLQTIIKHHKEIVKSIEDGDCLKAQEAASEHIKYHEEFMIKSLMDKEVTK